MSLKIYFKTSLDQYFPNTKHSNLVDVKAGDVWVPEQFPSIVEYRQGLEGPSHQIIMRSY